MSSFDRNTPRRCSSKPCYPNTRPGPGSNPNPHLNPHLNLNPAAVTAKSPARRSGRSAGCSCRCGSRAACWSCIPSRLCPRKIGRDRSTEGGRPSPRCRCPALYSLDTQTPAITIILLPMSAGLRQRRGPVRAAQHVPTREAAPDPPDPRENPGWDQDSLRRCSLGGTAAAAAALKCAEARGGDCGRGEAGAGGPGSSEQALSTEDPWLLVVGEIINS